MAQSKSGNKDFFKKKGASPEAKAPAAAPAERPVRRNNYLEGHGTALSKVASGELIHKTQRVVDPARVKIWERHNRRYMQLNEHNCADLIQGILAQGKVEFPAIVRKMDGNPDFDFELIAGRRRHWTVGHLREQHHQIGLLIEVRDLSDEEAFRLADIENRDRLDICDYERAMDYASALEQYYGGRQVDMARRIEQSPAWLSRFLDLAALPQEVVGAYADITQLKELHARKLKPLLKGKGRAAIIAAALELAARQQSDGAAPLDGATVLKELVAAGTAPNKKAASTGSKGILRVYQTQAQKPALEVRREGRSGLMLRIIPDSGASATEILEHCQAAVKEFWR